MPVTDAEISLIIQYLDNELTDDEEQQLIKQIEANPALQKAFDQQILMSNFLEADESIEVTGPYAEPADKFLDRITNINDVGPVSKIASIPTAKRKWQTIALAAAVAAVAVVATFYFFRQPKEKNTPLVKIPEQKTAPITKDSTTLITDTSRLLADNELMQKLFTANYKVLPPQALTVPAIASPYRMQYEQGRYGELAAISENSIIVKGQLPITEQQKLTGYFRFYKALANLQTGNTTLATLLLSSLQATTNDKKLSGQIEWYLLMAYLKTENKANALKMANSIANNSNSTYHTKAFTIQQELSR